MSIKLPTVSRDSETSGADLISALRLSHPHIAIVTKRFQDDTIPWGGDGPDPADESFVCYTVEVRAYAIHQGELIFGVDTLGACYFKPEEPIGEVHGYLYQMVEGAVEALDRRLAYRANPRHCGRSLCAACKPQYCPCKCDACISAKKVVSNVS